MQFRGSNTTSGRDSGICITIKAPSHTSLVVQQFLAEKNILVITQPSYSPDLAPSDSCLFLNLKMVLKGTELRKITKEAFYQFFQQCQDKWSDYMHSRALL
jgi:hypothetical protein